MPFTAVPTAITGSVVDISYTNIFSANDNWFNGLVPAPAGANLILISSSTTAAAWALLTAAQMYPGQIIAGIIATGAATSAKFDTGAVTEAKLDTATAAALAQSGMVTWVRKAADIATGWTRETNLDGRIPVSAGTEFGVTYVENTAYGASWSHSHSISGTSAGTGSFEPNLKSGGGWPVSNSGHSHALSGSTEGAAWVIPSRAVVYVRKT